jgi:protein O-GlcNAc transferase
VTSAATLEQALAHHQSGRLAQAESIYRALLARDPDDAKVLNPLGALLQQTGRSAEAHAILTRAAQLAPGESWIWNNLGEVCRSLGRRDEAIAALTRAVSAAPDHFAAHANLGLALADVGRLDDAVPSLRRAIEIKADYAKAFASLAMVLHALKRDDEALAAAREAVRLNPRNPAFHNTLGNVLRGTNKLDDAIAEFKAALALRPDHAPSLHNLGEALAREGEVDAGIDSIRRALAVRPNYPVAHQSLLFMMHYSDRFTPQQIFDEHRRWAQLYEAPLAALRAQRHENDRDPDRRLRVGYVSPDFRRHPVGYFMRPIFAHHDPAAVEVFAYNTAPRGDAATEFFRGHAQWRDVFALSDDELAQHIRTDRIDILIDLTLHMAGGRMFTFARKPAPIQATYLGYAHSTGLSSMDYKITDPCLDPPGATEQFHTEQIVRLPETNFCCEPDEDDAPAPPVGELPARTNGHVTFASFNTLMKTNAAVIETGATVLRDLPGSRLMIVATGLAGAGTQQRLRNRFTAHGITPDRLDLLDLAGVEQGLLAHTRADIALDTFPYTGGTTTANALWMGVPVITLAGTSPIARQGVSFLTNVGLPELIATTREQYVSIALELAGDLDRLQAIRATLRDRMRASPITNGPRFVHGLEQAYRDMWRAWCARQSDDE